MLQERLKKTIHEINVPVSTILLNTQMLKKNLSDEKSIQRCLRIQQASNSLLKLYNELEYSIKNQIGVIEKERIDVHVEIENSLLKFEDLSTNITMSNNVPTKTYILIDKNGFEKIVDNLLSNAIKYNHTQGYIDICFEKNILSFENSGKSINVENIFSVFNIYFQEDSSKNGFGL